MSWLSEKWYDRWPLNQPTNQPTKPLQQLSCLAHSQAPLEEQFLYYDLFYFLFLSTLACSCLTDINFLITNTSPSFDIYMTFCPAVCKFSSPEFWQIVMEIHLHKPSSNCTYFSPPWMTVTLQFNLSTCEGHIQLPSVRNVNHDDDLLYSVFN